MKINMRIHFIGIGGAIMHNLAIALKLQGHDVSGSDNTIYDPAKSRLKKYDLFPVSLGRDSNRISNQLDVVILGMTAQVDNSELLKARELGLKIETFPQFIANHVVNKTKVVVAGSHGKTTVTAMIMHILHESGIDHDYLVGSMLPGYEVMVKLSDAPIIIIEGDEYPESRETMTPKCLIYGHDIGIVNGIARDHINVFPTYQSYLDAFHQFVNKTPKTGRIFYTSEDVEVKNLMGEHVDINQTGYCIHPYELIEGVRHLIRNDGERVPLQIFGKHNMSNINAAIHICRALGVDDDMIYEGVQSFAGTDKRLSKVSDSGDSGVIVYRDFAHAPSKVRASLNAVREAYSNHTVVACYEMHTYSSTSADFLSHYKETLEGADHACVFLSAKAFTDKGRTMLDSSDIRAGFARDDIQVCTNKAMLEDYLKDIKSKYSRDVVYLMMSSGSFEGISLDING